MIAFDAGRGWLLSHDAGTSFRALGNPPELWLKVLPRYAELQRGEAEHTAGHLASGVPDLTTASLPARFPDAKFAALCAELLAAGVPDTIQHDDLHFNSVFTRDGAFRVLDWGDASISHPFASLVETFRFLEESNGLQPGDPWFARLRDAYLEPWGPRLTEVFNLALRVGAVAHRVAWERQREALPESYLAEFDRAYASVRRRAQAALR